MNHIALAVDRQCVASATSRARFFVNRVALAVDRLWVAEVFPNKATLSTAKVVDCKLLHTIPQFKVQEEWAIVEMDKEEVQVLTSPTENKKLLE